MKTPAKKQGGARPGSGPKTDPRRTVLLYNIAIKHVVSFKRARDMAKEVNPESLLGAKLVRLIDEDIAEDGVDSILAADKARYEAQRRKFGFKP